MKPRNKKLTTAALIIITLLGVIFLLIAILSGFNVLGEIGTGCLVTSMTTFILTYWALPESRFDEDQIKKFAICMAEEIGAKEFKEHISNFLSSETARSKYEYAYDKDRSMALVRKSTAHKPVHVGRYHDIKLEYFIDLMDLVMTNPPYLNELADCICHLIATECGKSGGCTFDKILSDKTANPMMAMVIAGKLNVPCVFYTGTDIYQRGNTLIEGNLNANDNVIVVHDVLATTDRIKDLVDYVSANRNVNVKDIFTFVERNDVCLKRESSKQYLQSQGITLHSVHRFNDASLKKLVENRD